MESIKKTKGKGLKGLLLLAVLLGCLLIGGYVYATETGSYTGPKLADGVASTTTAKALVNNAYLLSDLQAGKIFVNSDGTATSYLNVYYVRSTDNGETWGTATYFDDALYGATTIALTEEEEGTYMYRFYATETIDDVVVVSQEYWTLILEVVGDEGTWDFTFYVGRDQNYSSNDETMPIIKIYPTTGYDEDGRDLYDETQEITFTDSAFGATVEDDEEVTESGTLVNNYNMFYATLPAGYYSIRAYGYNTETGEWDISLGGMSLSLPTDENVDGTASGGTDIYLRLYSVYTQTKCSSTEYFSAENYYTKLICPIMGCTATAGDPYVSGSYTYYPYMIYAGGNACLYNLYVYAVEDYDYAEGYDSWSFGCGINLTQSVGYTIVTKYLAISAAVELSVTYPAKGEFDLYYQWNNFNTTEVEAKSRTENADGTWTAIYSISKSSANYTWRLTDTTEKHVTSAAWLSAPSADVELTLDFSEETSAYTHSFAGLGTAVIKRDEADIYQALSASGFLNLTDTNASTRIRFFRMWEIINSDTANIMIEPDFEYTILVGEADIEVADSNSNGENWLDVDPDGTAIIAVHYNAIDIEDNATHGGLFPATNPERTAVIVVSDEATGTADAIISYNGTETEVRSSDWDYNYDTYYYWAQDEDPSLEFEVSGNPTEVSYTVIAFDESFNAMIEDWWEDAECNENGVYSIPLSYYVKQKVNGGSVIIRLENEDGRSYRVVRAAAMDYTVENASNPGDAIQEGDKITVTFSGLYRGIYKISGVFNPTILYPTYNYNDADGEMNTVKGTIAQYQQADSGSLTVEVPLDIVAEGEESTTFTLYGGYMYTTMYSAASPYSFLYEMSDTGVGTNFNAVTTTFVVSNYIDIDVDVTSKLYYEVSLNLVNEDGEALEASAATLTDSEGNTYSLQDNGTYKLGTESYTYEVAAEGYQRTIYSFTLLSDTENEDGKISFDVAMVKLGETDWDGETLSEPETVDGVYQIGTGAELAWFAANVNSNSDIRSSSAVLTADINLGSFDWTPIANSSSAIFTGTFDGQGYTVSGLYIKKDSTAYCGLFGYVKGATIQNLTVEGSIFLSGNVTAVYAGGVVCFANASTFNNLTSRVDISLNRTGGTWSYIGGVIGHAMSSCAMYNLVNYGNISGYQYAAGVVGDMSGGTLSGAINYGEIDGYQYVGGVTGYTTGTVAVMNAVNYGDVTGSGSYVGGVSGYCASAYTKITNCANYGDVSAGGSYVGGIYTRTATCENCYNLGTISGSYAGGISGWSYNTTGASYIVTLKNCFNLGTIKGTTAASDITYFYQASSLSSQVIENIYYLDSDLKGAFLSASGVEDLGAVAMTAEEMASEEFVATLNENAGSEIFVLGTVSPEFAFLVETEEEEETGEAVYYAGIKDETTTITVGEKAVVTVYVESEDVDSINSLMATLTYDPKALSIEASDITGLSDLAQVTIEEGIITIVDFGDDKEVGDLLTLAFTGIATGESKISLTYVGVDTSTGAVSTDLDEAVIKAATAVVTVTGYTVSLSDYFTADSLVVEPGEDFTFTAKDTHYNYTFATTMGGEEVEVVNNGDGTYTIKNVTGNLVIEATATAKTYAVTVTGNGSDDLTYEKTATYGVDYPFTLDAGEGYAYTVVATIDGEQVEAAQGEEGTYTIAGANVTGDIAIAVTKEKTTVQVTFTGTGSGDVMGGASQTAKIGEAFTFTIQEDGDYEYTVFLGETALTKGEDGSYTIAASYITGEDIVVTVTKTAVDTREITVTEYIKLNGESIFLVKVTGSLKDGQVFAYNGVAMFTLDGDEEGAYYYLVISEGSIADVAAEAEEMVAAATATATAIVRDGDVNMTGVIDVNDAQLTYDIYNGLYTDFSIVSMEKFLRADVNGDGVVNVNDAVAALAKR